MAEHHFTVNGAPVVAEVEARTHLADFLRERLLLTGTHLGCEHGVCGACTVLIDGVPARSCITFAASCESSVIRTIEGFESDPTMAALREAFSAEHALQCGYCTPGMLITAYDIVRRLPDADEARVREELGGNLCRCTGYAGIVAAICSVLGAPPEPSLEGDAELGLAPIPEAIHAVPRATVAGREAPVGDSTGTGVGLQRRLSLALGPARLWDILRDPDAVVRCLPGGEIVERTSPSGLLLRFSVAIGPMRAAFQGPAELIYNDTERSGQLTGSGTDRASRTEARGEIRFSVEPDGPGGSRLALSISYRLRGPLAQFGRGAVVEAIVDQLLERFARNLEAQALGESPIDEDQPIPGAALIVRGLWERARAWFGG